MQTLFKPGGLASVFHINYDAAHVVTTFWANCVRRNDSTALWTEARLTGFLSVVRTSLVCSRIGVAPFWNSHGPEPLIYAFFLLVGFRDQPLIPRAISQS